MTGFILGAIATALIMGYLWHRDRLDHAARDALWQSRLDTAAGQHADDLEAANARADYAEQQWRIWQGATESVALRYINLKRTHEASQLGFLMPTVAGERAKVADRGNVVPLRRGGAS